MILNYPDFEICFSGCSVARLSRLLWEQEAAGSNPATPTKKKSFPIEKDFFCYLSGFFNLFNQKIIGLISIVF
jgi:hypothetical protein